MISIKGVFSGEKQFLQEHLGIDMATQNNAFCKECFLVNLKVMWEKNSFSLQSVQKEDLKIKISL